MELAITECIRDDILAEFLRNNRAEAKSVSIYEYDEEKHMRHVKEEGFQEGHKKGIQEGMQRGIQEGIQILVDLCREMRFSREDSKAKIAEKFGLEPTEAEKCMEEYWKQ